MTNDKLDFCKINRLFHIRNLKDEYRKERTNKNRNTYIGEKCG